MGPARQTRRDLLWPPSFDYGVSVSFCFTESLLLIPSSAMTFSQGKCEVCRCRTVNSGRLGAGYASNGLSHAFYLQDVAKIQNIGMSSTASVSYRQYQTLESAIVLKSLMKTPNKHGSLFQRYAIRHLSYSTYWSVSQFRDISGIIHRLREKSGDSW